jgi:hypothetical protein
MRFLCLAKIALLAACVLALAISSTSGAYAQDCTRFFKFPDWRVTFSFVGRGRGEATETLGLVETTVRERLVQSISGEMDLRNLGTCTFAAENSEAIKLNVGIVNRAERRVTVDGQTSTEIWLARASGRGQIPPGISPPVFGDFTVFPKEYLVNIWPHIVAHTVTVVQNQTIEKDEEYALGPTFARAPFLGGLSVTGSAPPRAVTFSGAGQLREDRGYHFADSPEPSYRVSWDASWTIEPLGRATGPKDWAPWQDMLNTRPRKSTLQEARSSRGHRSVDFDIQRIERANSKKINLDYYAIDIVALPPGQSASELFEHVRKNLNSFFDQRYSEFKAYRPADHGDWTTEVDAPLGAIMQFDIPFKAGAEEQAAVVTSHTTSTSWMFTTVTIGKFAPGEHPVSGHRKFAIETGVDGLAARIYTVGTDRALDRRLPSEDTVYRGADNLWKSFQNKLAADVNRNGGIAHVGRRTVIRPAWTEVRDSEIFDR